MTTTTIVCASLEATEAFGREFAKRLKRGDVVALDGELGAGKTHLVRAIAEGLGIKNPALVTSPTFVLIQEYAAEIPIYHFDTYRLSGPDEFLALGAAEYLEGDGVCLIEWAERVRATLPEDCISIRIEHAGECQRRIIFSA